MRVGKSRSKAQKATALLNVTLFAAGLTLGCSSNLPHPTQQTTGPQPNPAVATNSSAAVPSSPNTAVPPSQSVTADKAAPVQQVEIGIAKGQPNTADESGGGSQSFAYPKVDGVQIAANAIELAAPGGFLPSDIKQGGLGDCYFDATLAAIASAQPAWLNKLIKPATSASGARLVDASGYPLYTITMTYPSNGQMVVWSYLTDAKLPSNESGVLYDALIPDGNKVKIGIALLEKGYARLDQETDYLNIVGGPYTGDGYYAIGEGGWASSAFPALTGKNAVDVPRASASTVVGGITPGGGIALVADINTGYFKPQTKLPSGATIYAQGKDSLIYTSAGGATTLTLTDVHYYSFLGTQNGVTSWRNPWGSTTGVDGVFTLPLADVGAIFNTLSLVNLN